MEVLSDLSGVASGAGSIGLLVWLVFRTMGQSSSDRKEYQNSLTLEREAHELKVKSLTESYDKKISDLEEERTQLKIDLIELQQQFEEQRQLRFKAEDAAALYRRMVEVDKDGRLEET